MIKIIRGYYGYRQGNSIIPKTNKDEPFECDAKEEARLVKLGVAKYVEQTETEEGADKPLYSADMKLVDLKAIAKEKGATDEDLKHLNSKANVIELIEKLLADAEQTETEEGAEDAPDLGDVDGVVE
jgi:hypothetical protein